MNTLAEIKKVVVFTGGMQTKMDNSARTYKLPILKVKSIYIEAVNEVLHGKKIKLATPEDIEKAITQFNSDDYRQIWFRFVEKCQNLVKEEGGSRKGQITKLENKAKEISGRDVRRLKIRIGKLKVQLVDAKGADKKAIKEKIKKYEDFIEYTKSERALNHFVNKIKTSPDLTSFIFKASTTTWDPVVNV